MIELKTRNGGEARVVACLPAGEGVGPYPGHRLIGAWRPGPEKTWALSAWNVDGFVLNTAKEAGTDLMEVPPDIEARLSVVLKP